MRLQFLIFDASDNGDDTGTWEAMASVRAVDLPGALSEVDAVIAWAEDHSPGPRAPMDEGGLWDADVHHQTDGDWIGVTFTITGPWEWGEALMARFAPAD